MQIGIIRNDRRVSVETQHDILIDWGVDPDRIWCLGKGDKNLKFFIDAHVAREGDQIGIYRLALLIDPGLGS